MLVFNLPQKPQFTYNIDEVKQQFCRRLVWDEENCIQKIFAYTVQYIHSCRKANMEVVTENGIVLFGYIDRAKVKLKMKLKQKIHYFLSLHNFCT